MKPIRHWLSLPAFIVVAAVTAILMYPRAQQLGFSPEAISELVVGSVFSGVLWGAIVTWLVRRYTQRNP